MSDKIYVGNGKEITFNDGGSIIKLKFSPDDVKKFNENVDEGGWITLNVQQRKSPSKTGMTHYLTVDNWKPNPDSKQETGRSHNVQNVNTPDLDDPDSIPF